MTVRKTNVPASRWPCRERQVESLLAWLQWDPTQAPLLHVHGADSCGMSEMVRCAFVVSMSEQAINHSWHVAKFKWPDVRSCMCCLQIIGLECVVM